ncbi:unnamed protein product, partial [Meganyctiphanes norvegica]
GGGVRPPGAATKGIKGCYDAPHSARRSYTRQQPYRHLGGQDLITAANMSRKAGSKSSGKKAKKSAAGSNVFDMFTQKQVAEFKEGFQLMDHDKDGVLGIADLRNIFDEVGKIVTDQELDEMLADAPSPINFTMLLNMFAERSSGEQDDDEVVAKAFKAFSDDEGLIDADNLRMSLITFGDKFTSAEADDALEQMDIDDNGKVLLREVIELITGTEVVDEVEAPAETTSI